MSVKNPKHKIKEYLGDARKTENKVIPRNEWIDFIETAHASHYETGPAMRARPMWEPGKASQDHLTHGDLVSLPPSEQDKPHLPEPKKRINPLFVKLGGGSEFSWLSAYNRKLDFVEPEPFEELSFDDDAYESLSGPMSPIFVAGGMRFESKRHGDDSSYAREQGKLPGMGMPDMGEHKQVTYTMPQVNTSEYKKGGLLPLEVSKTESFRLRKLGYEWEEIAEIILNRYYR